MALSTSDLVHLIGEAETILFRGAPNLESRLTPYGSMVLTGEPLADANYIMVDAGPDPEALLREFYGVAQARSLPALITFTEPVTALLTPTAQALGLHAAGHVPLMTYEPDALRPPSSHDVQVGSITDEQLLRTSRAVGAAAFGVAEDSVQRLTTAAMLVPAFAGFLAWRGNTPVGSVWTTRTDNVVGIWSMATLPEEQRKGVGRLLLEHALAHHQESGATLFYLISTKAGYSLYERVGFRTVAQLAVWVAGHSVQVAG